MAEAPEAVHDYYRRAAFMATVFRRQGTTVTIPSVTSDSTTTTSSSSSTSSSSTSSSSTTSSSSQTSQTSRLTVSTRPSPTTVDQTTEATVTSDVSSTISSQYVTTNSSGQVVTTTLVIIPTSSTSTTTDSASSSTPVGPIVGGVVGGIAAIALVGLVIYLIRRKMRRDEFEANIFDPDRNVDRPTSGGVGPRFDLGGAGGGATAAAAGAGGIAAVDNASHVTPYSYGPASTGPTSNQGSSVLGQPEMQQAPNTGYYPDPYGQNQYSQYPTPNQYPTNSVGVGEHFPNPYAPGYHPSAAMAGGALGAGMAAHGVSRGQTTSTVSSGYPQPSPLFSGQSHEGISQTTSPPPTLAPAGAYAAQNPRSAKEREAFTRTNNQYSVSNQRNSSPTPSANRSSVVGSSVVGSSAVGPTSPVRVHQDGGRVQDEDEGGHEDAEIPPTYDSIPRGH